MLKALFQWLLSNGGPATVLLVASALFGWYLKSIVSEIAALESSHRQLELSIGGLVTKDDLCAALDGFELRLQHSLASIYLERAEYERRHSGLAEKIAALNR